MEQWAEFDPHLEPISSYPEENGQILVDVHQVVRAIWQATLMRAVVNKVKNPIGDEPL